MFDFPDLFIVKHSLQRAETVSPVQKTKRIVDILCAAGCHVKMGKQFLKHSLHARHFGIAYAGSGIAWDFIMARHLNAVDVILVKFRAAVKVMKIIQSSPNRNAAIKHRRTFSDELCQRNPGQNFGVDLGNHAGLLDGC